MENLLFHEIHQKSRLAIKEVNEVLKEYNLYSAQWSILFCLKQFGPMTQKEIWQYLNVEAPTVTRTLSKLEESGWAERNEGADKRQRIVCLTAKAESKVAEIEERVTMLEEDMLSGLSQDEQQQLMGLLKKIQSAARTEKDVEND
ncbi:MarR family winged helix-turn-helix transcriptional regulator [Planococcus halotolerans]|uniref:MarR family transcriptional regulator n=1 Tax=Planococcus halotolerans TaxID=2233542 RepID=A0A365KR75_9BACL|nr:MarR family transcriptional regulator [Planococcus halotolerans]QHJ69402.1 MarR family transcriptional regulator [Planococcus halotolerans]RAZ75616.1 MarR family transcriptional regulator [Planococcus halotolerans]